MAEDNAQIAAIAATLAELQKQVSALFVKVDALTSQIDQWRGSRNVTMAFVAVCSSAFGAVVAHLLGGGK